MAIVKTEKWECDFCRQSTATGTELVPPEGWLKIIVEDQFHDRYFLDRVVCQSCVTAICAALKQVGDVRGES